MTAPSWKDHLHEHRELLRPVQNLQAPSRLQLIIKRSLTIAVACFLLFLLLVYLAPGYDLLSVLEGRAASDVVQDHRITLSDGRSVVFTPVVFAQLQQLYFDNQRHEFSACLVGSKAGNQYILSEIILPKTYEQDVFHVRADLCPQETLIALHSHPYQHCIFSEADIRYYQAFAQINPEGLIGVMCTRNRFGFYP